MPPLRRQNTDLHNRTRQKILLPRYWFSLSIKEIIPNLAKIHAFMKTEET